MVICIF